MDAGLVGYLDRPAAPQLVAGIHYMKWGVQKNYLASLELSLNMLWASVHLQ